MAHSWQIFQTSFNNFTAQNSRCARTVPRDCGRGGGRKGWRGSTKRGSAGETGVRGDCRRGCGVCLCDVDGGETDAVRKSWTHWPGLLASSRVPPPPRPPESSRIVWSRLGGKGLTHNRIPARTHTFSGVQSGRETTTIGTLGTGARLGGKSFQSA